MSIVLNDDKRTYGKLIKRFPLRPIRDDEHNERAADICDNLLNRLDSLNQAERDYLEALTGLISKNESFP
jgi:hypothetical protein